MRDIFTKYILDPWNGRLFQNKNWNLNEDRAAISEYDNARQRAYGEYKSKSNDNTYRYKSYLLSMSYGIVQMSLIVDL